MIQKTATNHETDNTPETPKREWNPPSFETLSGIREATEIKYAVSGDGFGGQS